MTEKKLEHNNALHRLDDTLVKDILDASDEDIILEAREDGANPDVIAERTRAIFERSVAARAKSRLASAKAAVAANRQRSSQVISLDLGAARKRLERLMATNPEATKVLTLAARKGATPSDDDVLSMLEDLEELGISLPDDEPGGDT